MSNFDLVIFDCDGVLVDSEALASQVWCDFLSEYNVHLTPENLNQEYAGMTDGALAEAMRQKYDVRFDGNVPQQIEHRCDVIFDTQLTAIEGVTAVIKKVAGLKCICTNSSQRRLLRSLRITDLITLFDPDHLFSARMVSKPKPAPDLHLFAADKMGTAPANCLIIEDTVTGVTAGVAAGMKVYGYTGASHFGDAQADKLKTAGATEVFRNMSDILDVI